MVVCLEENQNKPSGGSRGRGLKDLKINEIWTKLFYRLTQETNAPKLSTARLEYHGYLIIVSCSSVSLGVLSILVLLLMLPVLPTHRDPNVKEEGLVPSGADG